MVTNHIYIPIGFGCDSTLLLRDSGLRKTSYPFDWCASHPSTIVTLLESNFNHFLEDYVVGSRKTSSVYLNRYGNKIYKKNLRYVHDVYSNTVLCHEYYEGIEIEEIKNQYKTRYLRMINDIKKTTDITLVHYYPNQEDVILQKHNKILLENLGFNVTKNYDTSITLQHVVDEFNRINPKARIKQISYIDMKNGQI